MTSQVVSTSRIDHFSSLPNELLDHIFDLAYLDSNKQLRTLLGCPLSKRLLPFYLRILRHTFSPSKWKFVRALNQAILHDSTIGTQIQQVDLKSFSGFKRLEDRAEFIFLLRHIPNIKEIRFALDWSEIPQVFWSQLDLNPHLFPNLRSLQIELLDSVGGLPSPITGLTPLHHLQSLTHLTVLWPDYSFVSTYAPILLPNVKYLSIRGDGSANVSCLTLVQSCPSLELLEFNGDEADGGLDDVLLGLPRTLPGLRLEGPFSRPVDQSLVHLTGLQRLHLGEDSYGTDLALHLSSLPLLETLTLEGARTTDEAAILADLVDGSQRLRALRYLVLNFTTGLWPGIRRADLDDPDWDAGDNVRYGRLRYSESNLSSIEESIVKARSRGISVAGSAHELRMKTFNYLVENHNRAVIYLIHNADDLVDRRDLEDAEIELREVEGAAIRYGFDLPSFVYGRRLSHGQIFKIPVDEDGRFVLGLKEEAGGTASSNAWGRGGG